MPSRLRAAWTVQGALRDHPALGDTLLCVHDLDVYDATGRRFDDSAERAAGNNIIG